MEDNPVKKQRQRKTGESAGSGAIAWRKIHRSFTCNNLPQNYIDSGNSRINVYSPFLFEFITVHNVAIFDYWPEEEKDFQTNAIFPHLAPSFTQEKTKRTSLENWFIKQPGKAHVSNAKYFWSSTVSASFDSWKFTKTFENQNNKIQPLFRKFNFPLCNFFFFFFTYATLNLKKLKLISLNT